MREDLQRRISSALDTPRGVEGDAGLARVLAEDAEAAAYARDAGAITRALAAWPLPQPDDDAMEALAQRIEQRLDEALTRMADPTEPPDFDDDDALRDATAGLLASSGEYEVLDSGLLDSIPPDAEAGRSSASAAAAIGKLQLEKRPVRPLGGPVAEVVGPSSKRAAAAPPPAPHPAAERESDPPLLSITSAAPARAANSAAPAPSEDRFSFPSVPPPPMTMGSIGQVANVPPVRESGRGRVWLGALAAAAAVGLGIFGATSLLTQGGAEPVASTATVMPAAQEAQWAQPSTVPPATAAAGVAVAEEGYGEATTTRVAEPVAASPLQPAAVAGEPRLDALLADPTEPEAPRDAPMRRSRSGYADREQSESSSGVGTGIGGGTGRAARGGGGARSDRGAAMSSGTTTATTSTRSTQGEGTTGSADTGSGARRAPPPPPPPAEDLPETPERGAVQSAIQAVEGNVRACSPDQHGTATVRIVVASSGRVTTATVSGQFAGTPIGSCVARAVRGARFPAFSAERFEITYPFQL